MVIENVSVDAIKMYERNAKLHPTKQVDAIAHSIKEFGFKQPLVIDAENVVVIGHGRLMAAKKLGLKDVPCVRADDLSAEQIKALRLADNKTNESEWDLDLLGDELGDICDIDMSRFGFEITEQEKDIEDVIEDEFDGNPSEKSDTERGTIWQLGEHRLMCGDSTSTEDLTALMDGAQADMVFTDPPYGVAIGDKNAELNTVQKAGRCCENIKGDTLDRDGLYKMLVAAFENLRVNGTADDCSYYVTSPQGGDLGLMMMMMMDAGLTVRHVLIWVKNAATFSIGRLDYDYRHEPIFYTWTSKHNFYGTGYNTTVIDDTTVIDKMSKKELVELVRKMLYPKQDSVVYCDKPLKCDLHPTMKPVKLISKFILNSSRPGDIILDIFGGSGSTMIAAEQLDRKCYMMELDPRYCDVIVKRWEQFTGQEAVKIAR